MSDALLRVAQLVNLANKQKADLEMADAAAAQAKADLARTLTEDLPELMRELTLTELKLEDGTEVDIREEVDCSITEANRVNAHAWLREHGFGALIKSAVSVFFGRDEEAMRDELLELLASHFEGTDKVPEVHETVHPATLKSFIKERRAAAADAPDDVPPTALFGIYAYSKAKVVPPKAPRAPRVAKKAG